MNNQQDEVKEAVLAQDECQNIATMISNQDEKQSTWSPLRHQPDNVKEAMLVRYHSSSFDDHQPRRTTTESQEETAITKHTMTRDDDKHFANFSMRVPISLWMETYRSVLR